MSKNTLVRSSGMAMMIGGVASGIAFLIIFADASGLLPAPNGGPWMAFLIAAFSYGPAGVGFGLLGIRARYGRAVGDLGDTALLLGAFIGTSFIVIGAIVQGVPSYRLYDSGFFTIAIGLFVLFATLNLYGILALIHRPQARWNGLGLAAGLPITLAAIVSLSLAADGRLGINWAAWIPDPLAAAYIVSFAVMGGALVMLGYLIQSDLPIEKAAERAGA